ncbi:hypothetical protein [Mucilaginibacter sp.]|uniref:hypothetical protein n=1 Tax=Mucilaginibacter sp. TaxID=1882438 RepID=UPI003D13E4D8
MNKSAYQYISRSLIVVFAFILLFAGRCNRGLRAIQDEKAKTAAAETRTKNLIKTIQGIKYTEVSRKFDNGLSFSPVGYQLVPEWRISFPSGDSVNIYSPRKGKFLNAPVVFDHDSIFNVAWAWLKLKYLTKDSLQFQVLHVTDKVIDDEKVHVFMSFYSNNYIKNVLHKDTSNIWKPSRKDTLYIKAKAALANKVLDSAFAGTEPASLTAKSPLLSIVKETIPVDDVNGGKSYDEYLLPTYNIVIHKAYDNFNYLFSVYVDEKGNLIFRKPNQFTFPEFKESITSTMKGITDGYLKLYLNVKAGKTLGIAHSSIVLLNVTGIKK